MNQQSATAPIKNRPLFLGVAKVRGHHDMCVSDDLIGIGPDAIQLASSQMSSPAKHRRLKVFFDGGCRPNPGRIEAAVVMRGVLHLFDDLGHGTNSDAEWMALISALELTHAMGHTDIELIGDAIEVIKKATRALSTGRSSGCHETTFLALCAGKPKPRIRWIKRAQNLAGVALAARHPR